MQLAKIRSNSFFKVRSETVVSVSVIIVCNSDVFSFVKTCAKFSSGVHHSAICSVHVGFDSFVTPHLKNNALTLSLPYDYLCRTTFLTR